MALVRFYTMEDTYKFSLKIEKRLNKRFENNQRGRGQDEKLKTRLYGDWDEDSNLKK